MTTVIHHRQRWAAEHARTYVYIGRPSKWGNPFHIGADGSRMDVINKFSQYWNAPEQAQLRADAVIELKNKVLGCFCAPLSCHGHVIADFVNAPTTRW